MPFYLSHNEITLPHGLQKDDFRDFFKRAEDARAVLKISQPVLSEISQKMLAYQIQPELEPEFHRGYRMEQFMLGSSEARTLYHAHLLIQEPYGLSPTDALVVACAIADPECRILFTMDQNMLRSKIQEFVQDEDGPDRLAIQGI